MASLASPMAGHVTPILSEGVASPNDKHVLALVEKLQRRLDAYQRLVAGGHHHSRTASSNVALGGSRRAASGGGGTYSPDEVSFVFPVGDPTAPQFPTHATGSVAQWDKSASGAGGVASSTELALPRLPASSTADVVRVRPRGDSPTRSQGNSHAVWTETCELYALAEALCTELNGGVNYRLLCAQYVATLDAVTTMVRHDVAMLRSSVVLPQCSVAKLADEVHELLSTSARLLKEAGVIDVAKTFPKRTAATSRLDGESAQAPAAGAETSATASHPVDGDARADWHLLNRIDTEPYMHASDESNTRGTAAVHDSAHSRASEMGNGAVWTENMEPSATSRHDTVPPHSDAEPENDACAHANDLAERDASPPPQAVLTTTDAAASTDVMQRVRGAMRYTPTPPSYSVPRYRATGSAGRHSSPAQTAPTRRLRRLEQLFGDAYMHDGDQFVSDVLGVVFRYQYDTLPASEPAFTAANTASATPSHTSTSGVSVKTQRSASLASTGSTTLPPSADVLARFLDFKHHTMDAVSALLGSYESLRDACFDSTPLRGDYVYQCLLTHTKPHEKVLALLDTIHDDRSVEELDFAGARIGDAEAASLLGLLPRLYRLHTLILTQCDLHDVTVAKLAVCARAHPTLRRIDLSRNDVTDAAFEDLVSLYVSVPKLEEVTLVGCPLSMYARSQLEGVKTVTAKEVFGQRSSAVRAQFRSSQMLAPVRPRSALHAYASFKSTAKRRLSQSRRENAPYAVFAASPPSSGVYARSTDRAGSSTGARRGTSGRGTGTGTASLPPIRPY